ncbi:YraN family protein [Anaplasma centrale]|uniref:YraN family protein n=1 Tax=Anaplasma centrale TaxID=769 RepID=UPI001EE51FE4|nr:YraN family protein [Anaplasma centrale]
MLCGTKSGNRAVKKVRNLAGYAGELVVLLLRKLRLHRILHHRYRSPLGEIDLIVQNGRELYFIEVKTSMTSRFREVPVTGKQRRSIVRTAQYFLSRHPQFYEHQISFEVYCISPRSGITRFVNAW